jgi:hypothetical protein
MNSVPLHGGNAVLLLNPENVTGDSFPTSHFLRPSLSPEWQLIHPARRESEKDTKSKYK